MLNIFSDFLLTLLPQETKSGAEKCEQCDIGKACGFDGLTEQVACTAGWSCKNPAVPKKCNRGSYQPSPGQGNFIEILKDCFESHVQITVLIVKRVFIVTQRE